MTHWKHLVVALVAALALSACSSSSDNGGPDPVDTAMPDPEMECTDAGGRWNADDTCTSADALAVERADAQRTAINRAIAAANLAVAGLTDDASDAAITSARNAVDAAKAAIGSADDVPDTEKAASNRHIATIEGTLNTKVASITQARDDAAEDAAKASAALGKAMFAALNGTAAADSTALNNAVAAFNAAGAFTINAAAGAGALAAATDPGLVTFEDGDSAGSLNDWTGTDYADASGTGDSRVTDEARVYTNQGAAASQPFADEHTLAADEDYFVVTTGGSVATGASLDLVMVNAFEHSGEQTHLPADRADAVYFRGTYNGAPGEYRCATGCSSTNDGSGAPSALGGTWHFTPDTGAMVSEPDAQYLYFGWWVSKDSDGDPTAASAFSGLVEPSGTSTPLTAAAGSAITGSATYAGPAVGKFAMNNPIDGTGMGGHFTANAELKATFGPDTVEGSGMTGTIDSFRLNDGSEDPGWSVSLHRAAWGATGAITPPADDSGTADVNEALGTTWSINDNSSGSSGTWSGQMYDEMPGNADADPPGDGSNIPTTAIGTFYSEFSSIGRMVGAFGAERTE